MLNRVILIGRLTRDPELKYTASGVAVATFALAVDRIKKSGAEKETDFINIVTWRQSAEFAANYLTKGRLVSVEGRLQVRSWVAQDGAKRYSTEVVADNVTGLDRPKEGSNNTGGGYEDSAPPPAEPFAGDVGDNDPFADE
jgi:single-strand DNA-binding protein